MHCWIKGTSVMTGIRTHTLLLTTWNYRPLGHNMPQNAPQNLKTHNIVDFVSLPLQSKGAQVIRALSLGLPCRENGGAGVSPFSIWAQKKGVWRQSVFWRFRVTYIKKTNYKLNRMSGPNGELLPVLWWFILWLSHTFYRDKNFCNLCPCMLYND